MYVLVRDFAVREAGRLFSLLTSTIVLVVLLAETTRLYAAESIAISVEREPGFNQRRLVV
jgi:hypothetical protein